MGTLTGNNVTMSLENQLGSDGATAVATTFADQTELITLSNSAILRIYILEIKKLTSSGFVTLVNFCEKNYFQVPYSLLPFFLSP